MTSCNQAYPSPGAVGYAGEHPALERIDWHLQEGPQDEHLDELEDNGTRTGMSPYATTEAAQKHTAPEPQRDHAGPGRVRDDVTRFAYEQSDWPMVREAGATGWNPASWFLQDGAQSFLLAGYDPYRKSITVRNHTDGDVWIASNDSRVPGVGSILVAARDASGTVHEVTMTHNAPVSLFTITGYAVGASQRPVCVSVERWG